MKRRTIDQRACRRKRKYTEEVARARARELNRRGEYLHAYKCPICGGWHIGRVKKKARLAIAFERAARGA